MYITRNYKYIQYTLLNKLFFNFNSTCKNLNMQKYLNTSSSTICSSPSFSCTLRVTFLLWIWWRLYSCHLSSLILKANLTISAISWVIHRLNNGKSLEAVLLRWIMSLRIILWRVFYSYKREESYFHQWFKQS